MKTDDAIAGNESAAPRVVYAAATATSGGDGTRSRPFTLAAARDSIRGVAAGVTVLLAGGMGQRASKTGKFMPAGLVATIGALSAMYQANKVSQWWDE